MDKNKFQLRWLPTVRGLLSCAYKYALYMQAGLTEAPIDIILY